MSPSTTIRLCLFSFIILLGWGEGAWPGYVKRRDVGEGWRRYLFSVNWTISQMNISKIFSNISIWFFNPFSAMLFSKEEFCGEFHGVVSRMYSDHGIVARHFEFDQRNTTSLYQSLELIRASARSKNILNLTNLTTPV